jgi:hypothetical protein
MLAIHFIYIRGWEWMEFSIYASIAWTETALPESVFVHSLLHTHVDVGWGDDQLIAEVSTRASKFFPHIKKFINPMLAHYNCSNFGRAHLFYGNALRVLLISCIHVYSVTDTCIKVYSVTDNLYTRV